MDITGLSVDAGGTLLHPAEPVARTYQRVAAEHGLEVRLDDVEQGLRRAWARPRSGLRYRGDGRPFWRRVVAGALGTDDAVIFEVLYEHYRHAAAWRVDGELWAALQTLRARGWPVALLSNWDDRLRPLLGELDLLDGLDAVLISAELGSEKPDPRAFAAAARALGVPLPHLLHLGDDLEADHAGALAAGAQAWAWIGARADATDLLRSLPAHPGSSG